MSSTSPQDPAFEFRPEHSGDIESYRGLLFLFYFMKGTTRMRDARVTKVVMLKQVNKPSQHEYLVAHVAVRGHAGTYYIAIERGLGHATAAQEAIINSLSDRLSTGDHASIIQQPYHHTIDKVLGHLDFSATSPVYLFNLIILIATVHRNKFSYRLYPAYRYWLAGMVLDVLTKWSGVNSVVTMSDWQKNRAWWGPDMVGSLGLKEDSIRIEAEFEVNKQMLEKEIVEHEEHRIAQETKEERQLRTAAEARAQAADAQVQEPLDETECTSLAPL